MLMIEERLLRVWLAYKRLTELSFPRRFPVVQFPNLPLIVAVLAGEAGKFLGGTTQQRLARQSRVTRAGRGGGKGEHSQRSESGDFPPLRRSPQSSGSP
jgi:hypothetical protein